jgi:RHS repeat-associated protein
MKIVRRIFVLLGSLSIFAGLASAQVATGTPPFGSFGGGPDIINLANLNVHVAVPVFGKAGRGLPFGSELGYDTSIWYPVGSSGSKTWQPLSSWGWIQQTASVTGYLTSTTTNTQVVCFPIHNPPTYKYVNTTSNFVYHDRSGTTHPFLGSLVTSSGSCSNSNTLSFTATATDASGLQLNASASVADTVVTPSGTVITPPYLTLSGSATEMDANGNEIGINSSGVFTDTLGSTALTVAGSGTPASPMTYTYTAPSGSNVAYTVKYTAYTVKTNYGCTGISEYGPTAQNFPSEIDRPNGTKYTFAYEATPGFTGDVTGRLASVTLPTGGTISYTYTGSNNGISCTDGSAAGLTRVTPDGTWTYARSGTTTTVTAPQMPYDSASNQEVYTFNSGGLETQRKMYQGSATSGTLLRTANTTWATNNTPLASITILEDNSTQFEAETTYDNYGNLLTLKEHDLGSGSPGSILRTTTYTYLSTSPYTNLNIVNRVTEETIADSAGTTKYRADTAYDGTTISPCPAGVTQHDDSGHGCSFATRGNPTSFTTYTNAATPSGPETKNSYYDFFGNLVQAQVDCCQLTTWSFSAATQYTLPDSKMCGASGGPQSTTAYTYNAYTRQLASATDPNNQVTTYTYDSMLRPLVTTRPDSSQENIAYNDSVNSIATTEPVDVTHSAITVEALDSLGRISTRSIQDASSNVYSISQIQYDPLGRAFKKSNPYTSTPQYWITSQFDGLGRSTKRILQDGSQQSNTYSLATVTTADPAGHQRKYQFDGANRLVTLFEPDPANGNSLTLQTSFAYSVLDVQSTIAQGAQTRTFGYDGMGRLTSETHPESGTTSYQYNNFDKLTQRTDNRGVITTYTYDTMNRRYQLVYNVGTTGVPATPTVTYTYGTNANQLNNDRLLSVTEGTGSKTYTYDDMGRKTQEAQVISGTQYTIGYQYNQASEVTSLTYPSGRVVQQTPDAVGRLASIASGTTTYMSGIAYDTNFVPTGFVYGNGVNASISVSPDRRQMQTISYSNSGGSLFSENYNYASSGTNNGHITGITDSVDSGRNMAYAYDALERLTSATSQGSTTYPQWGLSWTYDRYGNRTTQTVTAGTAPPNSVTISPTTNQITTSGYSYDANGNMTNDSLNTLIYDAENRATSSTGSGTGTYAYDASGLRVLRTTGGTTTAYVFSGGHVIAEYTGGNLTTEYIYARNSLIAEHNSGTLLYHGRDHHSVRINMDVSGNTVGQQGHFPYGEDWYMSNTTTNKHFTTYDRDTESWNDYARARYHVNRLGRFLTVDPARPSGSRPQLLNRYSYVASDPISLADPSGRNPFRTYIAVYCDPFDYDAADCEGENRSYSEVPGGSDGCGVDSSPLLEGGGGNCLEPPLPTAPCEPIFSAANQVAKCDGRTLNLATMGIGGSDGPRVYQSSVKTSTDNDLFLQLSGEPTQNPLAGPNSYTQEFLAFAPVAGHPGFPTKGNIIWEIEYSCFGGPDHVTTTAKTKVTCEK